MAERPTQPQNGDEPSLPEDGREEVYPFRSAADFLRAKGKGGRKPKLEHITSDQFKEFLLAVRSGAFDHVAARRLGVHTNTYAQWISKGMKAKSGLYYEFVRAVLEARAFAQVLAETEVRINNPLAWLKSGPGKREWSDPQQLDVFLSRGGDAQHENLEEDGITSDALSAALKELADLGFIQATDLGKQLFGKETRSLELQQVEGEDDDDELPPSVQEDLMIDVDSQLPADRNGD